MKDLTSLALALDVLALLTALIVWLKDGTLRHWDRYFLPWFMICMAAGVSILVAAAWLTLFFHSLLW